MEHTEICGDVVEICTFEEVEPAQFASARSRQV